MWILCLLFSLVSAKGIVVSIILLIFLFEFTGVNCSAEPLIPSTGFIRANVDDGEPEIIRVLRQIPRNPICKTISFVNIPEPNASPLMGPNEFRMVTDGVYNGHFAWSNGPEFISFVNSAGPPSKGNWLLGNRAGMDSGYVYITTQSNGDLTPLHQESSTNTWKWLQKSQWVDFPDLYMICMDEMLLPSVYYEVEHYHNSHAPVQSYLIPNMNTFLDPTTSSFFHLRDFHLGLLQTALLISLQKDSMTTALITNVENITTFGALSLLSPTTATTAATTQAKETKNSKKNSISTTSTTPKPSNQYGILVNIEHIDLGWHLTYREITFTSTKYTSFFTNTIQTSTAATGAGGDSEVIFTQNMTQTIQQNLDTKELSLHVFTHNRIQRTMNSVSKTSSSSSTTDKSTDSTVPYQITPLSSAKRQAYYDYWMSMLERVQVGDYLWVWYSPKLRSSSSTTGSSTSSGMRYGDDDNVPQDDVTEIEIEELILQCVGMNTTHVFFHLHPTHRMDVMQSTLLHTLTTVITIPITNLITSLPHQAHGLPAYYGTTKIVIHSGLLLPKHQILTFLWKYIHYKETELNGLSSCYMYHAAVSMPQVFVYANELLCLLLGSKPVVMVQYTSPSEHQWKFPLIPALTTAFISLIHSHPKDFPIDYRIFKYQQDETLVFYHKSHTLLMESLLPFYQAQALHPLPYVNHQEANSTALLESYREQIYFAAWNGLLLGYPERFVQYYCEDFHHNELSREEKSLIFRNVKDEITAYFYAHEMTPYEIHYGYIPVSQKEVWLQRVEQIVNHHT